MKPKAVILFSGGLDSTTCLALAKQQGFECYVLNIDYGQRHHAEMATARHLAELYEAKYQIMTIPLNQWGGSALTDLTIKIPDYQGDNKIPVTYVPARNTIFLSLAIALAEIIQANDIFIGVNAQDYSGYPDCRPDYIEAFQKVANLATKAGIEGQQTTIHTPLIYLTKAQIIQLGTSLNVDYRFTMSCYRADDNARACGQCDSCVLRKRGFQEAGVADPTIYVTT